MMTASRIAPIVTLVSVILVSSFRNGEAIICYQCNSEYDPRCGDPFDPYSLGTVNCSFQPRPERLSGLEPTICRKISQKVYGKTRVVRGCGYVTDAKDDGECLKRSGTHDVRAVYCACTGDLCNSAERAAPSFVLPLASVCAILLTGPSLPFSRTFASPAPASLTFSIA